MPSLLVPSTEAAAGQIGQRTAAVLIALIDLAVAYEQGAKAVADQPYSQEIRDSWTKNAKIVDGLRAVVGSL